MRYVAIEFYAKSDHSDMKGFLTIPDQINPLWSKGFRKFLRDKYLVDGPIKIYPLSVKYNKDNITNEIFNSKIINCFKCIICFLHVLNLLYYKKIILRILNI